MKQNIPGTFPDNLLGSQYGPSVWLNISTPGISSRGAVARFDYLQCVRSQAVPEAVLRRVYARAGEKWMQHLVNQNEPDAPEASSLYWSMWYGPDIIRGPDGHWCVIEDNLGYVGGFGDTVAGINPRNLP